MESITAALAALEGRGSNPLSSAPVRFHTQRRKEVLKSRDRKRFQLRPENADRLVAAFPGPGEDLHAFIPGDFAFGDLIDRLIAKHGLPKQLDISTLSLSEDNVHMLLRILGLDAGFGLHIRLLLSHYFQKTSADIWRSIEAQLIPHPRCKVAVSRQHSKLILLDYGEWTWAVAGSANLRSSGCFEQLAVFTEREVFDFYQGCITRLFEEAGEVDRKDEPPLVPLT